ncbi:lysogenization regulator HflD [Parashewanella curva]|uniref:High frequency lysogenization protein HflD homolog n=1 Tax=Parashewanella curva TaxID=2338552 RepID=A0A3L8PZ60_9GAMM|nr:high frequency lysogenization protein HflD [Parashewanella curva]RLV60069.1 lysogenization regulator HflD [Parashewanella curva]
MDKKSSEQAIAFAGILYALKQVQKVARADEYDTDAVEASLNTLLVTNPDSVLDIYQDRGVVIDGSKAIIEQLESDKKDMELTRYLVGVLSLERKLARSGQMGILAERISQIKRQTTHFNINDNQVISNIASIYSDLISNLGPKIMVVGNPNVLKKQVTQERVRSLLLSAIRSAVLWRQLGGKRRELVFFRKRIINAAKHNLKNI